MTNKSEEKKQTISKLGITITYKPLGRLKGYFDQKTGEICINSKIAKKYQESTLIHEFLHAVSLNLKLRKVIKKEIDHNFITNAAQPLLACFVLSGRWKGIPKNQIKISK